MSNRPDKWESLFDQIVNDRSSWVAHANPGLYPLFVDSGSTIARAVEALALPRARKAEWPAPEATETTSQIGRVVWVLWKDDVDRVWRLLRAWAQDGMAQACRAVLHEGIQNGHLRTGDVNS